MVVPPQKQRMRREQRRKDDEFGGGHIQKPEQHEAFSMQLLDNRPRSQQGEG